MRELIWALIAGLVVYLMVIGWKMWRMSDDDEVADAKRGGKRNEPDAHPPRAAEPRAGAASDGEKDDADDQDDEAFVFEPYIAKSAPAAAAGATPAATPEPPPTAVQGATGGHAQTALDFSAPPPAEGFQLELEVRQLRRDIVQLRNELAEQRREAQRHVEAMQALKEHVDSTLASQGISPEYNEALVFARRGMDVDVIAERCGISVAEAELVHSLAQGRAARGDAS